MTNVLYRKEREEWYFKGENLRELYRSGVVIFFILDGSFFLEATMYTEGFLLSNTIAFSRNLSVSILGVVIIRVVVVLTAVFRL